MKFKKKLASVLASAVLVGAIATPSLAVAKDPNLDNVKVKVWKNIQTGEDLSDQEIKNYYLKHKEKYSEKFENIKDTVRQDIKEEYYRKHEDTLLKKERKKIYNKKYRLLYRIFK